MCLWLYLSFTLYVSVCMCAVCCFCGHLYVANRRWNLLYQAPWLLLCAGSQLWCVCSWVGQTLMTDPHQPSLQLRETGRKRQRGIFFLALINSPLSVSLVLWYPSFAAVAATLVLTAATPCKRCSQCVCVCVWELADLTDSGPGCLWKLSEDLGNWTHAALYINLPPLLPNTHAHTYTHTVFSVCHAHTHAHDVQIYAYTSSTLFVVISIQMMTLKWRTSSVGSATDIGLCVIAQ